MKKIALYAVSLFLALISLVPANVYASTVGNSPYDCKFQSIRLNGKTAKNPDFIRTHLINGATKIWFGSKNSGNLHWQEVANGMDGLHRWQNLQWPAVDTKKETRVPFANGGVVLTAIGNDPEGGGAGIIVKGEGKCTGWYFSIFHLPEANYTPNTNIGPNQVIGIPGCTGFTCSKDLVAHNHESLFYCGNGLNQSDIIVSMYIGAVGKTCHFVYPLAFEGNPQMQNMPFVVEEHKNIRHEKQSYINTTSVNVKKLRGMGLVLEIGLFVIIISLIKKRYYKYAALGAITALFASSLFFSPWHTYGKSEPTPNTITVIVEAKTNSSSLKGFTPEVLYWESEIISWAEEHKLDPSLVATVMQIESCGNPDALSGAGAMGLFQVMPYHFQNKENGYDPQTNASRGLSYLRMSLESGGSIKNALAGYNGGITGASRGESYWPNETQRYVYWGTGIYNLDTRQERLQEWLNAGGSSLCKKAKSNLNN